MFRYRQLLGLPRSDNTERSAVMIRQTYGSWLQRLLYGSWFSITRDR